MNSASTTWPLRTVAHAAQMKPRALRQWLDTKVMKLRGNDRKSTGPGNHCGLSRQRAYQAAIVQHLNRHGVSVSSAAKAAFEFSDCGNMGRAPGEVFEHGKTWLLIIGPDSAIVKNIFDDTSLIDISDNAACIIVDLNKIVEQVDAVLNTIS